MGTKAITVPVVAELQMELKSLQNIEKVLTDTFNKAGTGTTLAKNLSNSLTKIRPLLKEYEQLQIQPGIDAASLHRMNSIFNSIFNEYTKRAAEIEFMSPENMLPESALTRLREMRAELANLQKDLASIEKNGASGKSDDYFYGKNATAAEIDLHRRAKQVSQKYSGEATLSANASAVEQEAATAQAKVSSLQAAGERLAQAFAEAESKVDEATQALQTAQANFDASKAKQARAQKAVDASNFITMLGGLSLTEDKKNGISVKGWSTSKENVAAFTQKDGTLQKSYQDTLQSFLTEHLGVEAENAMKVVSTSFEQIPALLAAVIKEQITALDTTTETYSKDYLREHGKWLKENRGVINTEGYENASTFLAAAKSEHSKAATALSGAQKAHDAAGKKWLDTGIELEDNKAATAAAQETADALSAVSTALTEVAKTAKEAAAALKKEEIENREQNINTETQGAVNTVKSGYKQVDPDGMQENHRVGTVVQAEQIDKKTKTQQDAESFKQNLQQSIKQWMSAQQIVNMVKDGIRQAYQDIQGLDKAMTNIAVVTDMSVGDLWGKINEYMSVAQQYGVSTQGVYEVSQLYYQQGLGTADVMAATTETLKMARIAGMDYADAADAMTVAIRSFKMEMSDAAHVTDVYSKVAAITASDSEELAIAMSKTASSAENVGSSFENTTAMLAVMIETTRESAQNLGSALKSIISRYGEMKVGATVDADGEALDYNKVDTALKSIGISIKDAQGQFRDFDDVIFELSSKWDSLDSVTQRYIATIMAGNRQQSRFIALVDNWERLDEVSGAAQNSDDAGLVQYAKTLDSLESKLNNIKTSFQEFYMSIVNGPVVSAALDFINNLLQGLNQLGSLQGILNIANLIAGLKTGLSLLGNLFANSFSSIVANWKAGQEEMVNLAFKYGQDKHKAEIAGYNSIDENGQQKLGAGQNQQAPTTKNGKKPADTWWGEDQSYSFGVRNEKSGKVGKLFQYKNEKHALAGKIGGAAAGLAGTALTAAGTAVAANNPRAGAWMSAGGNALQGVSMGAAFGPWGMVIGGVLGALSGLPGIIKAMDNNNQKQFEYEQAKKKAEEAKITKAETKDEYNQVKNLLESYDKLKENRNNSEEDYQAWIDANNQLAEAYPQLISYIDAEGNAIVDVTNASTILGESMKKAARASEEYYRLKRLEYDAQIKMNEGYVYRDKVWQYGASVDLYKSLGLMTSSGKWLNSEYDDMGRVDPILMDETEISVKTVVDAWEKTGVRQDYLLYAMQGSTEALSQLNQAELNWYNALNSGNFGLVDDMFTTNKDGKITGWETHLVNYLSGQTGKAELESTNKQAFQDAIYWQNEAASVDDVLSGVSGSTAIIDKFLRSKGYNDSNQIDSEALTTEQYSALIKPLTDAYDNLSSQSKQQLSGMYDNLDSYSYKQLEEEFNKYYGGANESNPLWNAYASLWMDQNYRSASQYGQALLGDRYKGQTYEEWLGEREDSSANREAYYEQTLKDLAKIDPAISDFIANHTSDTIEGYIDFLKSSEATVKTGGYAGIAAKKRMGFVEGIVKGLGEDGTYGDLSLGQTSELLALLTSEDAGTQAWADALTEFEEKYGIEIADFDQYVFENFTTHLNSLTDNLDDSISDLDSLLDKQSKGLSFKEAMSYYKKYAKEGQSWDDFYTVTADGKLIFSDFRSVLDTATEQMQVEYDAFVQNAGTMIDSLEGSGDLNAEGSASAYFAKAIGRENLNYTKETEAELRSRLEQYFREEGFTEEEASSLASTLMSSANMTTQQFIDYMENMVLTSEAAQKYWEQNKERLIQEQNKLNFENAADNFTAALEGPFDEIEEGYKILSSVGITGLDADNVGKLLASGLFKEEDFVFDEVSGTYSLSAAARESLSSLPPWIQNTIEGMIEGSVDSAKNEMTGLAGQLFGDETSDATFASTFSHLQKTWKSSDIRRAATYALMQAVTGDTENLTKMITREYAARAGVDEATAAVMFKDEIAETQEEMIANFKDSYVDQIKTYNDLVYKKITGSATAKELEQLDDLAVELDIDLEQFTGRLIDDLKLYAQAIVDNAYLSTDEKNKYLKDTYDTMFGATAYAESYGVDANYLTKDAADAMGNLSAATKVQISSKNRMTQDQAATFAASIGNAVGLSPDIVMSMFDYNQDDATWSFDSPAGKSAKDLQMTALWQAGQQNTKVMEEFQKHGITSIQQLLIADADAMNAIFQAAMASEDQQILGIMAGYEAFDMIADSTQRSKLFGGEARAKTYATAVEQFASGQEMTFEELVNLYSELGQPIDTDELYRLWLQGPEAVLNELMSLAEAETGTSLTAEQLSSIKAAKERGVTALLDSIASIADKAINGTATVDDLLTLAKNTGIDLSGKVIKTANGYSLNQTGMLAVAAARGRISGDYAGEAANLIEMYAGRGGTFGSSAGIDAAIARNESALNGIIQEAGDLLTKEDKFLTEEQKAKKKQYKLEKEQLEAEKEVLLASKDAFAKSAAKNAANFMNSDPYGSMGEDFANFLQSKQTAKEVLKEAYGNKGIISDYTQAGQFLEYIGYGQNWSPSELMRNQNIMASYIKEDGSIDFVAGLKAIFPDWADLTPTEVLEKVAPYLDTSDQKVIDDYKQRIAADEEYLTKYDKIKADETQRVEGKTDGLITTKDGKNIVDVAAFNKTITDVYGDLGVTDAIIADIAKTRYGEDWQTELADPEAMAAFMKDFDSLVSTFEYDPTSTKTAKQQFEEHIKGESAAQEVEERLKQLEEHLKNLTTDEAAMRPLLDGLDKSIQKAQYLNSLLVEARLGHSYSTGLDSEGNYTGVIFTDKTNVNEQNGTDQYDKYKEQLAQTYGLTKSQMKYMKYDKDSEGNITGITYTPLIKQIEDAKAAEDYAWAQLEGMSSDDAGYDQLWQEAKKATKTREGLEADYASMPESDRGRGEQGFSYQFRDNKELNTTGVDPNGTIKYTGDFKEIDDWIAENKHIEAIYTLSTPDEAKNNLTEQLKKATEQEEYAWMAMEGMSSDDAGYDQLLQEAQAATAEVQRLQSELDGLNERYPGQDDGTIELKVTGTAPKDNAELQSWLTDLKGQLAGAGNVPLKVTDESGKEITDLTTILPGQTITISATTPPDADPASVKSVVDTVNAASAGLQNREATIEVKSLTPSTALAVGILSKSLENLNAQMPENGIKTVDISIQGNLAESSAAASNLITEMGKLQNGGKPFTGSADFTVNYLVGGKPVTFDANGLPIIPKIENEEDDSSSGGGDAGDPPGTITLTIKEVDKTTLDQARTQIDALGQNVAITFVQNGQTFTDMSQLKPDAPIEVQVQYKADGENGEQTSQEIVDAISGIVGEKPVTITVDGLSEESIAAVDKITQKLSAIPTPPENINIQVNDADSKSLSLAQSFADTLNTIKANYDTTITATIKYVDEGGGSLVLDENGNFVKVASSGAPTGSNPPPAENPPVQDDWQYGYDNKYFLADADTAALVGKRETEEERAFYRLHFGTWLEGKEARWKELNERDANTLTAEEFEEYQSLGTVLSESGSTIDVSSPKHTQAQKIAVTQKKDPKLEGTLPWEIGSESWEQAVKDVEENGVAVVNKEDLNKTAAWVMSQKGITSEADFIEQYVKTLPEYTDWIGKHGSWDAIPKEGKEALWESAVRMAAASEVAKGNVKVSDDGFSWELLANRGQGMPTYIDEKGKTQQYRSAKEYNLAFDRNQINQQRTDALSFLTDSPEFMLEYAHLMSTWKNRDNDWDAYVSASSSFSDKFLNTPYWDALWSLDYANSRAANIGEDYVARDEHGLLLNWWQDPAEFLSYFISPDEYDFPEVETQEEAGLLKQLIGLEESLVTQQTDLNAQFTATWDKQIEVEDKIESKYGNNWDEFVVKATSGEDSEATALYNEWLDLEAQLESIATAEEQINTLLDSIDLLKTEITTELGVDVSTEEAQGKIDTLQSKISALIDGSHLIVIQLQTPETPIDQKFTGNVNGIALAKGNATSLIDGAKLANKTLVGELGPELGVWDGQYHLLGQHGAEFVNMPSDAIVFNHKQTKGIVNGQWGYRGKALAEGNVSGPAYAGGHIFDPWGLQYESFSDFVADLGKGGGGKQVKATIAEDLEEWYNLLRKIAKLEAEINLIQAERANMLSGNEILRSYREQQALLHEQIATQKLLIEYQKEQLKLEADRIKQNDFWGKSLTFNEDGTLLSIFGNEANGGRGVFAFLDQLNELSGNQQVAMLKKLGYTYKDRDGKELEGEELVKQFMAEYQEIVTHYNELDDSILSAENTIEGLITSINELEQEIKDNQKDLEKSIYDILVEAAEREIEQVEKQNELLKEANEKYVQGLTNALNEEQSLYERNEAISDREALQRQLSLLRRSGGSASEIEALEQQLDDTLKNEYFDKQQQMIEDISKANERQAELMEQQVKLQQEALEYQKENGVLWTDVYKVMNGSYESILNFFSGNSKEFFEASALGQETMLLKWARMIGIYDEDRAGKQAKKDAAKHWEDGTVDAMFAKDETTSEYKDAEGNIKTKTRAQVYSELSDEDKKAAQEHYNAAYTSAVLEGKTTDEAKKIAYDSMVERLRVDANLGQVHWDPHDKDAANGNSNGTTYQYSVPYTVYFVDGQIETGEGRGISKENAQDWAEYYAKKRTTSKQKKDANGGIIYQGGAPVRNIEYGTPVKLYATGGLVDYTGVAMVHGSKSKPESFLNAEQTAQITQALHETSGKESVLGSLQSTMDKLKSVIHNFSTINNSNTQSISIAPGAVVIQVEQLADSYDIEEVSRDVMNRMVTIANKATNRGVNRR